jgi:undecaprenyl phosphate N,N'-diacetylbacillosamine 1-phosphate transferase
MRGSVLTRAQVAAKRAMDVLLAGVLLILLLPLLTMIALVVMATSPGEAIFRQERGGREGRLFVIYKFRTMTQDAPRSALGSYAYSNDPRITRVGRFLRRTSLDELPQLVNVLKGDMSIVGPRPDLPHHVEKYTAFQRRRLQVRPGVTGWAQVSGRNELSWDERIKLDVEYVERWSLFLDLMVLLKTFRVVLSGKGSKLPRRVEDEPWRGRDRAN